MKRETILTQLRSHRDFLRSEFGVQSLALFGSLARDESRPDSDVDILIDFDRPVSYFDLFHVEDYLTQVLGVAKVDLVMRRAVHPALRDNIFREAIDVR